MHTTVEPPLQEGMLPALELSMQELEAMEAPGFWSIAGYVVGAGVSGSVVYSIVATILT